MSQVYILFMWTINLNYNVMKIGLMIIVFFLSTISCASQKKEMISRSTIKLEGQNTNIRDCIEIDGYYQIEDFPLNDSYKMFFEDGTYVSLFWFKENVDENFKKNNLSQAIRSWKQKDKIRWGIRWGVYKIEKDTLVGQYFQKGTFFGGGWWECVEEKYVIIDKHTLIVMYSKSLFKDDKNEIREHGSVYEFVAADSLPSSDCWLKEEKWIWRNESDWKAYMDRIKQNKKK